MYEHQSGEFVCGYWAIRVHLFQHFNTSACAISFFLSWLNPLYNNLTNVLRINLSKYPYQEICSGLCFLGFHNSFWWSISFVIFLSISLLTVLGNNFFLFLLFALLLTLLFAVLLLGRCSSSGRVLSFIRSAILDTKLHFPNVALMWLLKSIAVIIMCSRPS